MAAQLSNLTILYCLGTYFDYRIKFSLCVCLKILVKIGYYFFKTLYLLLYYKTY